MIRAAFTVDSFEEVEPMAPERTVVRRSGEEEKGYE